MPTNTINAVLGDVSFVKKFGTTPTPTSGEALRIRTHLEYVETLLRAEDVSHLSWALRERRTALLDKLHEYRLTSAFPTNLDFPQERRPCFIDAAGNICAVGFLIEQTAGRALAERINAAHRYDFLADMHLPELTAWVEASGLTARECAMIQPGYDYAIIQDLNFKAFVTNPIATSALQSGCIMDIELRGIDASLVPVTTSTLNLVFNKLFLTPRETIWFRYGTNWGGLASFRIPNMTNITAGTYQLGLVFFLPPYPGYTGLPDRYITTTNITISPATSIRDLTLPSTIPNFPQSRHRRAHSCAAGERTAQRPPHEHAWLRGLDAFGGFRHNHSGCGRTERGCVFRGGAERTAALGAEGREVLTLVSHSILKGYI